MQSVRWFLKLTPDDARLYSALKMIAVLPFSSPNSSPSVVCTFSEHGAVRYTFCMSDVLTSRSFSAAKVRAILTDSLDATLAYVRLFGASPCGPKPYTGNLLGGFHLLQGS